MVNRLTYLFNRYFEKTATREEREELLSMIREEENNEELNNLVAHALNEEHPVPDINESKAASILASILKADPPTARIKPIKRWMYAAAVIALIAISAAYFFIQPTKSPVQLTQKELGLREILPGYNHASLILHSGTVVKLDTADQQTIHQGTTAINRQKGHLLYSGASYTDVPQFNTLITPKGGQYRITLPDQTDVWLNAASTLRFPVTFTNIRTVELSGEAYFEVAKDTSKPFFVKTGSSTVKVLGTHFNIMAYENEKVVKTTLLEGAVHVFTSKENKTLSPGSQAIVNPITAGIRTSIVDVTEAVAWKEGYFFFNGANLPAMMRQFERWYNIEIVLGEQQKNYEFMGKIPRTAKLSSLLKLLSLNNIPYTFEQNKLIIQP